MFGRKAKSSSKLKEILNHVINRIAVLKRQPRGCCRLVRKDILELLGQKRADRALSRLGYLIENQNKLDAFDLIENFCRLLLGRISLLENTESCPDELREAVSSLIFASSRSGELLELKEARSFFTSLFGTEFTSSARDACGVNMEMIEKMSRKQPTREVKLCVLKEIAAEGGIHLTAEFYLPDIREEGIRLNQDYPGTSKLNEDEEDSVKKENSIKKDQLTESSIQPEKNQRSMQETDIGDWIQKEDSIKKEQLLSNHQNLVEVENDQLVPPRSAHGEHKDILDTPRDACRVAVYASIKERLAAENSPNGAQTKTGGEPDGSADENSTNTERNGGSFHKELMHSRTLSGTEKVQPEHDLCAESDEEKEEQAYEEISQAELSASFSSSDSASTLQAEINDSLMVNLERVNQKPNRAHEIKLHENAGKPSSSFGGGHPFQTRSSVWNNEEAASHRFQKTQTVEDTRESEYSNEVSLYYKSMHSRTSLGCSVQRPQYCGPESDSTQPSRTTEPLMVNLEPNEHGERNLDRKIETSNPNFGDNCSSEGRNIGNYEESEFRHRRVSEDAREKKVVEDEFAEDPKEPTSSYNRRRLVRYFTDSRIVMKEETENSSRAKPAGTQNGQPQGKLQRQKSEIGAGPSQATPKIWYYRGLSFASVRTRQGSMSK